MNRLRHRLTLACFAALLVLGLGFALIGLIVVPMLPTLMLDVVVAPEDIADVRAREETLSLLRKAWGDTWLVWSGAGLLVFAISSLGLWASRTGDRPEADTFHS